MLFCAVIHSKIPCSTDPRSRPPDEVPDLSKWTLQDAMIYVDGILLGSNDRSWAYSVSYSAKRGCYRRIMVWDYTRTSFLVTSKDVLGLYNQARLNRIAQILMDFAVSMLVYRILTPFL